MLTLDAMVDSEAIQDALDAAVGGDLDPLVELFSPDLDWWGLERGHLWWKKAPA
jgi:ketosteroid isomerase-like protein